MEDPGRSFSAVVDRVAVYQDHDSVLSDLHNPDP